MSYGPASRETLRTAEESVPRSPGRRRRPSATLILCLSASIASLVGWLSQPEDPVRMPILPLWATATCAAGASLLSIDRGGSSRRDGAGRLVLGAICCIGLLAGTLPAFPHSVLMTAVWVGALFTNDTASFEVQPVWGLVLTHVLGLAACAVFARSLLRRWRSWRVLCPRCGNLYPAEPVVDERHTLAWLGLLAVLSSLPYGFLKLAWSLGSSIGLTGHAFDDVSFASPGFGDTVVLTSVAIATSVVMGIPVRKTLVRRVALTLGTLGSLMLLPVGFLGALMMGFAVVTDSTIDRSEIAPWAFGVVFASFLTWGISLALLTLTYERVTRVRCTDGFHCGASLTG